ncbi:MAG: hypothetical protein V7756_11505 [Halopseudomonas sp.]|uniref:hypothetical protein n=1 Tax=Halopseudomonas sp. TaxID=2901191 RepID=UPI0030028E7E
MLKILVSLTLFGLLAGCVAAPVVPPIQGPKAVIDDSYLREGQGQAHFFYVESIDGKWVKNTYSETYLKSISTGAAFVMTGQSRELRAEDTRLALVGRIGFAVGLQEMMYSGERYLVEGSVNFSPKADTHYLVKGALTPEGSAVWVEDTQGNLASSVVGSEQAYVSDIQRRGVGMDVDGESGNNSQSSARDALFASIQSGESSDAVKARMGEPDRYSRQDPNPLLVGRKGYSSYHYDGLGEVQIRDGFVFRILPQVVIPNELADIRSGLYTGDSESLRQLAQNLFKVGEARQDALDLVAQRLWDGKAEEGHNTVDAMAWFCRLLGKSGNSRYRKLMAQLEQQAETRKLRRYAGNALQELPVSSVEQFEPRQG